MHVTSSPACGRARHTRPGRVLDTRRRLMNGRVSEFDAVRGVGTIDDAGGVPHRFHAANIADGSRRIEVGTDVSFERLARFGAWEATSIRPRS